jgi:hypothetical protein
MAIMVFGFLPFGHEHPCGINEWLPARLDDDTAVDLGHEPSGVELAFASALA